MRRTSICLLLFILVVACVPAAPTPYPTFTPYPTYTPCPTYTPYPTYTPVPGSSPEELRAYLRESDRLVGRWTDDMNEFLDWMDDTTPEQISEAELWDTLYVGTDGILQITMDILAQWTELSVPCQAREYHDRSARAIVGFIQVLTDLRDSSIVESYERMYEGYHDFLDLVYEFEDLDILREELEDQAY